MREFLVGLWTTSTQTRPVTASDAHVHYRRVITIVDLTSLGLANVLGTGMHLLLSVAAHQSAGPSVVLSFILVAVTTLVSGLCHAELAEEFPGIVVGGSCYSYAYAIVGQLGAFLLGWNAALELLLGSVVAAKAWSQYADFVLNGTVRGDEEGVAVLPQFVVWTRQWDFKASALLMVATAFVAFNTKAVFVVNNFLVVSCFLFVGGNVLVGLFNMDAQNWTSGAGFFPDGFEGILSAAAICAFSFVGMDLMATASAETPSHPRLYSTATSCVFVLGLLACFVYSVVLTQVVSYAALVDDASVANVFVARGIAAMRNFVFVGATCGLFASVLAISFAQGRVLQVMAHDGFLCHALSRVHPDRGTPLLATVVGGTVAAISSLVLDTRMALDMLGAGTLLGMAAAPLLVLLSRHSVPVHCKDRSQETTIKGCPTAANDDDESGATCLMQSECETAELLAVATSTAADCSYGSMEQKHRDITVELIGETIRASLAPSPTPQPSAQSSVRVKVALAAYVLLVPPVGLLLLDERSEVADSSSRILKDCVVLAATVALLILAFFVAGQPRQGGGRVLHNEAPCLPWLPLAALTVHLTLMTCLPFTAWIRLLLCSSLGLIVYLSKQVKTKRSVGCTAPQRELGGSDTVGHAGNEASKSEANANDKDVTNV